MDQVVKRGVGHIIKKIPTTKPEGLNKYQEIYYTASLQGRNADKEIVSYIETIALDKTTYNITCDEELWLAAIFRAKGMVIRYLSAHRDKVPYFLNLCKENDAFDFISLTDSINVMKSRYEKEKEYFEIVKAYYSGIVVKSIQKSPLLFFDFDKTLFPFLREVLGIDTYQFELSPKAFEIVKSKDWYLLGLPAKLQTKEIIQLKLFELTNDHKKFYENLRQYTKNYLTGLDLQYVINGNVNQGDDILDFPIEMLEFSIDPASPLKVIVSVKKNARSYSSIYKFKESWKLVEEHGEKFLQVRDYPLVQITGKGHEDATKVINLLSFFEIEAGNVNFSDLPCGGISSIQL